MVGQFVTLLRIGEIILAKQQQLNKTVQFRLKNFSNVSGRIRKKYCDNLQRMLRGELVITA